MQQWEVKYATPRFQDNLLIIEAASAEEATEKARNRVLAFGIKEFNATSVQMRSQLTHATTQALIVERLPKSHLQPLVDALADRGVEVKEIHPLALIDQAYVFVVDTIGTSREQVAEVIEMYNYGPIR